MKKLKISYKGQEFISYIDDRHYNEVIKYKWRIIKRRQHHSIWGEYSEPNCYKKDFPGAKRGKVSLSQFIWFLEHGQVFLDKKLTLDHINRNPLDNQIANLRPANDMQQLINRSITPKSGHRGITKRPNGRFQVKKQIDGKETTLGTFKTIEEAIDAYNRH